MEKSLEDITEEGQFGHFALKLSALLSIEAMTELSQAQDKFSEILLKSTDDVNKIKPELFLAELKNQLGLDIELSEAQELFQLISFSNSEKELSEFEVWAAGHLF